MYDTNILIVGNVLATPEWRRVASTGALMASFRIASTARRWNRETDRWEDGRNARFRVVAWRRLAEGIASSIVVGDPVMVYGRIYTRDWKDDNGDHRTLTEIEAFSIGHDLSRGRAKFFRTRPLTDGNMVEDAQAATMIGGEPSVPLTDDEAPIGYGDGLPEPLVEEQEPSFLEVVATAETSDETPETPEPDEKPEAEEGGEEDAEDAELSLEVERLVADQPARRGRRARKEPVAA